MLIENVEALKTWMTRKLSPICDADPAALARYVVALVKKDKTEAELKEVCADQLDVFLQDKTPSFVETLFEVLKTKAYLSAAVPVEAVQAIQTISTTVAALIKQEPPMPTAGVQNAQEQQILVPSEIKPEKIDVPGPKKRTTEEETQLADHNHKSIKKDPSSPRDKARDIDERRHHYDSRSRYSNRPHDRRSDYRHSNRGRDRHRSRSRSPRKRLRRSRSPLDHKRNRSPKPRVQGRTRSHSRSRSCPRSWSRSRSRSLTRQGPASKSRSRSNSRGVKSEADSRGSTPLQDQNQYNNAGGDNCVTAISSVISVVSSTTDTRYEWGAKDGQPPPPGEPAGPSRPRCNDYDEKGFCMRGDLCPFDHGPDPVVVEDVALPSVLPFPPGAPPPPPSSEPTPQPPLPTAPSQRPPTPPAEPMTENPVVPSQPTDVSRPPPPGTGPTFLPNFPPPDLQKPPPPHHIPPPGRPPRPIPNSFAEGYNPEAPALTRPRPVFWPGPRGPPRPPPGYYPPTGPRPRDLVSVPTETRDDEVDDLNPNHSHGSPAKPVINEPLRSVIGAVKRPYSPENDRQSRPITERLGPEDYGHSQAKKAFDFNRLGGRRSPVPFIPGYMKPGMTNPTLEVRKIPPAFNNIMKLNEHFGKFGTLVNIQVSHDNDPEAALITYSNPREATAAYRCSDPVFNNRFIKLFFHNKDKKPDQQGQSAPNAPMTDQRLVKPRAEIPHASKLSLDNTTGAKASTPTEGITYTSSMGHISKTVYNHGAVPIPELSSPPVTIQEIASSKLIIAKRQEEIKKEALKKRLDIQKQKQKLLQKQLQEQKLLIKKFESNVSPEDKAVIMKAIKSLAESIEKLKVELVPKKIVKPDPKSSNQTRKELLDTELELMNKQNTGEDTRQLIKKLHDLKTEAASLGLLSSRGRGRGYRGRGSFSLIRGRPRQLSASSRVVDRRPKQLFVTGFLPQEKTEIATHFSLKCQVDSIIHDDDENSAVVNFVTRQDAEQAMQKCGRFKTKSLVMKWHVPRPVISAEAAEDALNLADNDNESEPPPTEEELDEDALLAGEDEEEEDEESRSWRR